MTVSRPIFITGDAGTGKTSLLMKRAGDLSATLITVSAYQSVLAITQMHGARRRVDSLLKEKHPLLPVRVTTIHSFALDLVNRWRSSLGYEKPILVHPHSGGLQEHYGSHRATEHIDLSEQHRTDVTGILEAARSLRHNVAATKFTIPKYWAPKVEMLAWKIVFPFLKGISGTCAVICPANDPQLYKLIDSFNTYFAQKLAAKNPSARVPWFTVLTSEQEREILYENLGIDIQDLTSQWAPAEEAALNVHARTIQHRVQRFQRLTGIQSITTDLVAQFAQSSLHADRSYTPINRRYEVTTVHGAKNREFDHVFVFWGYKVPSDQDKQRKLLYNAITRAKKSCILLVQKQNAQVVASDPVLRLLGQYEFVFPKKNNQTKVKKASA